MYKELVARLRERAAWINFPHHGEERPTEDAMLMMQAADAIEELSREIDIDNAAMTAMDAAMPRWIPVTEALPKDEKDVLAYYGFVHDGEMSEFRFIGAVAYFAFDTPPHWQHESTGLTVTHWMPLPQPPTECRQMVTDSNQLIGDSEQLGEPVSNPYKLEEQGET